MGYGAKIVVRKDQLDGTYRAGFASDYPLNQGWETVKDFGVWQGSQMGYKPFIKALNDAHRLSEKLNAERLNEEIIK